MSNQSPRFPSTRRALRKTALFLSALTFGVNACSTQPSTPQQEEQGDSATATFSIKAADFFESSGNAQGRSASSLRSAQAFTFNDVRTLRISVTDKLTGSPLYVNFNLGFAAGEWSGQIPFLPKNKALVFHAVALNAPPAPKTPEVLFEGTTEQTLGHNNQSIVVALSAANDGRTISIPRIRKISVPSAFGSDQAGNVSFTVEANTGENLTYEIIPAQGGGTFYPTTGSLALAATTGTFVSQYAPPTVSSNAEFEHTVRVTNQGGHSVTTTFKTKVKPPGSTDGVQNTGIEVLVRPVINGVTSSREQGTGRVHFQASVSDNDAATDLRYAWSFTSAEGTNFNLTFSNNGTTNPVTLQNYTTAAQGRITFAVTDTDNGTTTLTYPLTPNQYPDNAVVEGGLTGINSIRAGESHTCALFNNGTLRCWGLSDEGQLGYGNTFTIGDDEHPSAAGDVPLVGVGAKLAVGAKHTCALLDNGLVRCWGKNEYGQLGYNTTLSVGDGEAIASYGYVNLGGVAVKIAAGYDHTCALMNTGNVRCWGRNTYGQLGRAHANHIGDNEQVYENEDSDVEVGGSVKNIVAGGNHTCALLDNGKVRCWGYNGHGQLGYGHRNPIGDSEDPADAGDVPVGGDVVMQLAAGENHTCAVLNTGNMRCWGYNGFGQLGYGDTASVLRPEEAGDVEVGGQVLQVAAGKTHTCALLGTGDLKCWGNGGSGRLGYGNTHHRLEPSTAVDLDGFSAFQVTAGGSHTCALLSTGGARCWGENGSGQLGYSHDDDIGDTELPSSLIDIQLISQ